MKLRFALAALLLSTPAFAQGTPPSIKAPTLPAQAANKAYVDSTVSAAVSGLSGSGGIADAPNNGTYYLRRNGIWTAFGGPLADAPNDGQVYGRSGGSWAAIGGSGASASVTHDSVLSALGFTPVPEAPNDSVYYVRRNVGGTPTWAAIPAPTLSQVTTALGFTPVNKAGDTLTGLYSLSGSLTMPPAATPLAVVDMWSTQAKFDANDRGTWLSGGGATSAPYSFLAWSAMSIGTEQQRAQNLIKFHRSAQNTAPENALAVDAMYDTGTTQGTTFSLSTTLRGAIGSNWMSANDLHIDRGWTGALAANAEYDVLNLAGDPFDPAHSSNIYNHFWYGFAKYPGTEMLNMSVPAGAPAVQAGTNWVANHAYATDPHDGAPIVFSGGNYYWLISNSCTSGTIAPTGIDTQNPAQDNRVSDGGCIWEAYKAFYTNGVTGGAWHNGIAMRGGNLIQNIGIFDGTNAQKFLQGDAASKHTNFIEDLSQSTVGYHFGGVNSSYGIEDTSTSGTFAYIHGSHNYAGILDRTSATAFRSEGTHANGAFVDTSTTPTGLALSGTYSFAQIAGNGFSVGPTGTVCITGANCLAGSGVNVTLANGSNTALAVYGGNANGLGISTAGTGFGPTIAPIGPDTNINLNLNGKGTGSVFTLGKLTANGGFASTTGTFSGAVSGTTGTFSGALSGTTGTFSGTISAQAGLNVPAGQGVCLNGAGSCWTASGNNATYTAGGYASFGINGGFPNGFRIDTASAGFGPSLNVTGSDTNTGFTVNVRGTGQIGFSNGTSSTVITPGSATLQTFSDRRLKRDIVDAGPGLPTVLDMHIRDYTLKADGSRHTGVIAQELQETHPDMVHERENGMLAVDAPNPWVMVKAIQEMKAENDNLRMELRIAEAVGALCLAGLALFIRRRTA